VWKGGSEQHLLTPVPGAPLANSKKLFFVDSFMSLTRFSKKGRTISNKIDKIQKIHAPKTQGFVFSGKKASAAST
jgi:hypothetical protein